MSEKVWVSSDSTLCVPDVHCRCVAVRSSRSLRKDPTPKPPPLDGVRDGSTLKVDEGDGRSLGQHPESRNGPVRRPKDRALD